MTIIAIIHLFSILELDALCNDSNLSARVDKHHIAGENCNNHDDHDGDHDQVDDHDYGHDDEDDDQTC